MNEKKSVHLFVDDDLQTLLYENKYDLAEMLIQKGYDVNSSYEKNPTYSIDNVSRSSAAEIIIASAALILSLTPVIQSIIETLTHKEVVVVNKVAVPVQTKEGKIVKDSYGNPLLNWIDIVQIEETTNKSPEEIVLSMKGPFGWEIKYKSKVKQKN